MLSSILDDIKYNNSILKYYFKKNDKVKKPLDKDQIREIEEVILGRESLFLMLDYENAYNYYCTETERRKQLKNNRKLENWYSYYDDPSNLRGISAELNAEETYIFFYSRYSKAAHGNDSFLGKMVSSGEHSSEMVQLRLFSDLKSVFQYILCCFGYSTANMLYTDFKISRSVCRVVLFLAGLISALFRSNRFSITGEIAILLCIKFSAPAI